MKISAKWLKDYIDFEINANNIDDIVHRLAILGFESEGVEHIKREFDDFVVGKVLECVKHPNADKLSLCKVDVGTAVLPIVCGAPNVAAGQTVPVALEGAKVKDFVIKKTKIRGEESIGMICAEDELGLSDDHEGIMILDNGLDAGTPLKELFGYEDIVFELEVTSNRADALGYLGFGREFAFMTDKELRAPEVVLEEAAERTAGNIEIEILDPGACPRYCGRVIKNIKIGESPDWLKQKLLAVGLRPINNVVDITNFVMLETGHPLHAFDLENISGRKIIVRKAKNGEKFVTLDGKELELNDRILMICDAEKPAALAGVMGGLNSGVTEETTDVLLEVAYFNLADIRETVKFTNIHTDSSKRFERGVDPNDSEYVINRAAALIKELAGGDILSGIADCYPSQILPKKIELRLPRTEKVLGFKIDASFIVSSFNKIELAAEVKDADTLCVTVPTFRPDITGEIDLIEEAVRLYGYDKIPELNISSIGLESNENPDEELIDSVRDKLKNLGLTETFSKSMVDGKYCAPFGKDPVRIEHPLNEEMNHLRNSLILPLLLTADKNIRRKVAKISIFETGRIFYYDKGNICEKDSAAVLLTGIKSVQTWHTPETLYDFYDIKGIVTRLLNDLNVRSFEFSKENIPAYFDPSQALNIIAGGKITGTFGLISKETAAVFEIKQPVYCFESGFDQIRETLSCSGFSLNELSKYPKVIKDISVLMPVLESADRIEQHIRKISGSILEDVYVADIYKGEQVGSGKKSYTFRMSFQPYEKTLSDKDIEKVLNKIINGLKNDLQLEIR